MNFRQWLIEAQREMTYGTHPDEIDPIQQGEQFRVFHGFRSIADALNIAKNGTSGKLRVPRVYSYEGENNPKGLFVSLDLKKVASEFAGGYTHGAVMEFTVNEADLEPPTWPGGSYTVQGQMAPYFYQDPRGARVGRVAKKKEDEEDARKSQFASVSQSNRPGLARTLFGSEMQALFVGDLNPESITRFWIQEPEDGVDYRRVNSEWKPLSREEFLQKFDQPNFQSTNLTDRWADSRGLSPQSEFDWQSIAAWFNKRFRAKSDTPIQNEKDVYDQFAGALIHRSVKDLLLEPRGVERIFSQYLWPKQLPAFYKWLKQMYRQYGEPQSR